MSLSSLRTSVKKLFSSPPKEKRTVRDTLVNLDCDDNTWKGIINHCDFETKVALSRVCKRLRFLIYSDSEFVERYVRVMIHKHGKYNYFHIIMTDALEKRNLNLVGYICKYSNMEIHRCSSVALDAARMGYLDGVKFIREQLKSEIYIDDALIYIASGNGDTDLLQYLIDDGCKLNWTAFGVAREYAAERGNYKFLNYFISHFEESFECSGETRKYYQSKITVDKYNSMYDACLDAVMKDDLGKLCVHFKKSRDDIILSNLAANLGHIKCLKFLHGMDCVMDATTCESAAEGGHLDCLEYAHKSGCALTPNVMNLAAKHGQFECLLYAHQNGCKYDNLIKLSAIEGGNDDCIEYVTMIFG